MPEIAVTDLSRVSDLPTLFGFLNSQLGWKVDPGYRDLYDLRVGPDSASVRAGQIPPFSGADPFVFVVAEFEDRFRRTALRETLRDIRRRMRQEGILHGRSTEDVIFLCPCDGYEEVRFAHFEERDGRQPSLSAFGWERRSAQATRTVRELNLDTLRYQPGYGSDVDTWRAKWLQAWDVEAVTRGFFETYKRVFEEVEPMMAGVQGDRRLFAQRLFNRLLFIRFLEKKGWLHFDSKHPEDRDPGYLARLFNAAGRGNENFFRDRLFWLFFRGLGNTAGLDDGGPGGGRDLGFLRERRGDVPYLNGGLFEQEDVDDFEGHVEIPNEAFERIINGLFYRYNFTVTESAPDDVEVAVDPEMLGKVFEELVTGRHDTGSYYTPRPIVSFMCREALKGYLGGQETLVDRHDAGAISVPEARELLARLAGIRVVDPACGSGAYLLGMLYELFTLTKLLDTRAEQATARDDYNRKLDIIQNNLYGVDLDPFAVNVARLRLWLSLVVEYQGDDPPPLPNLDFKIEVGDSLTGPNPATAAASDAFRHQQIRDFDALKSQYARAEHPETKAALKGQIAESRRELAAWVHPGEASDGFDWRVEFAEVFESRAAHGRGTGGFDVVLANPPYVRQELIRDQKPALRRAFPDFFTGTADLYCYFYKRATELLCAGGTLVFISSNKWLRADYGGKLREHLAKTCRVRSITDFGDLPVFATATAYPMIFIAEREAVERQTPLYTQVRTLDPPYPDVLAVVAEQAIRLPSGALEGENWAVADHESYTTLRRMGAGATPLYHYLEAPFYRGVTTGLNEAFVIDEVVKALLIEEDPRSAEIIRPFLRGRDLKRWCLAPNTQWLIFTRRGVAIGRYPAIERYLCKWRRRLAPKKQPGQLGRKPGRYEWYEIQDETAYFEQFSAPKIVSTKLTRRPAFAIDTTGQFLGNTAYFVPARRHATFVLGLLNSTVFEVYARQVFVEKQNGWYEIQPRALEAFPIPTASASDRAAIEALVQKCLDAKGEGCAEWEAEIDERVAALYGV